MAARLVDPDKRRIIEEQADKVAWLIGVDPEEIMYDPHYGISLNRRQAAAIIFLAEKAVKKDHEAPEQ